MRYLGLGFAVACGRVGRVRDSEFLLLLAMAVAFAVRVVVVGVCLLAFI